MPVESRGRVLVSYGGHGVVRLDDGSTLNCKYRRQVGRPYCGDRVVVISADQDSGVVEHIEPSRNRFVRADQQGRQMVVATNLDQVMIVIAPCPSPSLDLMERYLVAVQSLGILPVIVVNKSELLQQEKIFAQAGPAFSHLEDYRELGYHVVRTSCKAEPGVGALIELLHDNRSILVGQSGVGKSSLVNRVLPDMQLQTSALSEATGKGTHTTTTTTLYDLPTGGQLIDSPGVWEFGIWKLEDAELAAGFPEFGQFLGQCRFHNCRHHTEPACAVKAAVEEGLIQAWRHESYLRLLIQNAT
jgi:ribosome biogenesis GTPase